MPFKSDKLDYWQHYEQKPAHRSSAKKDRKVGISDN